MHCSWLKTVLVAIALVCSSLCFAPVTHAESFTAEELTSCRVERKKIVVVGKSGTCFLTIARQEWIEIGVPSGTDAKHVVPPGFDININAKKNTLNITAMQDAAAGARAITKVFAPAHSATIVVHLVESTGKKRHGYWELANETEAEAAAKRAARRARARAATAQKKIAAIQYELDRKERELAESKGKVATLQNDAETLKREVAELKKQLIETRRQAQIDEAAGKAEEKEYALHARLSDSANALLEGASERSVRLSPHPDDASAFTEPQLGGSFTDAWWEDDYFLFGMRLASPTHPFRLAGATVHAPDDKPLETRIVNPAWPHDRRRGIVARVGSRPVDIVIAVKLADALSLQGFTVKLSELSGKNPVLAQIPRYPNRVRLSPETHRQKQRRLWASQTIVGVRATYGALWIADGMGQNRLEVTDVKGLGVRYTKGLHENWAIEANLAFGTTGQARFDNMMIDGQSGELTRDAILGRVGFGGVFRFGYRIQPHVRLGVAGQGARFGSEFTGATGTDESSFEFSALLTFGGGVQLRVGKGLIFGATLSAETPLGGSDSDLFGRAVSFGGHVAFGW